MRQTVAALGVAREALQDNPGLSDLVLDLQRHLFVVAADLSANPSARHRLTPEVSLVVATMTDDLERRIDRLTQERPLRPVFIVPGATRASAAMDLARTVARRAERHLIRARATGHIVSPEVVAHLNRLSDPSVRAGPTGGRHGGRAGEPPLSTRSSASALSVFCARA